MQIDLNQQYSSFSFGSLNRDSNVFGAKYNSEASLGTASVFAADIVSRIGKGGSQAATGGEAAYQELGKKASKNLDALQASLENTINSVGSRHGVKAATAVMGIVYQNVDGNVTEENLGQGFIEAIRFIDRNYGISEGNRLMGELNESVNKEMNDYFGNGHNEVFFDATHHGNALRTAKGLMEQTDGIFDSLTEGSEEGGGSGLELAGAISAKEMREMALEAQAKRMLANGELPPAYLQEYLPDGAVPGAMINATV